MYITQPTTVAEDENGPFLGMKNHGIWIEILRQFVYSTVHTNWNYHSGMLIGMLEWMIWLVELQLQQKVLWWLYNHAQQPHTIDNDQSWHDIACHVEVWNTETWGKLWGKWGKLCERFMNIWGKVMKVSWEMTKAMRKWGQFDETWGKLWGGANTVMRKCYISDNFPHFLITFLAAMLPCCQCFHRTVSLFDIFSLSNG